MRRRRPRLLISVLTACVMLSMMSLPATAQFVPVPKGQMVTATEDSYLCSQADGRDVLAMIRTERAEKEVWKQAVEDIRTELSKSQSDLTQRLSQLEEALNNEREARVMDRRKSILFVAGALALGYVIGD